ncbi:hypothetical protein YC2023_020355 [Brassica napus]
MLPYPNITATPKGAHTLVYQHIINHLFHSDLITSLICQLVSHSLFVCLRLTSVILFTPVTSSLTIHSLVMATLLLQPIHLPIMHVYPPAPGIYIHQPMIPQSQNLNQNRNRILQISSQNSLYIFITLHKSWTIWRKNVLSRTGKNAYVINGDEFHNMLAGEAN